jgi:hypothetical protein
MPGWLSSLNPSKIHEVGTFGNMISVMRHFRGRSNPLMEFDFLIFARYYN